MAGFNLKEGQYEVRYVSDDELWSAVSVVFTNKSKNDTSYKFGFLKSIIDNLYNVDSDLKLTFDQLFSKFGEIYWNLVLKYGLRQKAATQWLRPLWSLLLKLLSNSSAITAELPISIVAATAAAIALLIILLIFIILFSSD